MLQSIRGTAGSWVVKILFILLIVSFGFWGMGPLTGGVGGGVAEIGDVKITPQELDREYRSEIRRLRQIVGPELTDEQARQFGLVDRALEQIIQRTLLSLAAKDQGLRVGDAAVAREASTFPAFRNGLGQFDPNVMRAVLAENGLTEQAFVEQMRSDIARSTLVGGITGGTAGSKTLAESLFRYRQEQRVFDVVTIPNAAMAEPANPDDAAVAQYHQDKAVRYTAPEYRTLQVATLTADALAGGIEVSDEDVRAAYDNRAAEFVTPERRSIVQAVFADKAAAEKALAALNGGRTVEQVAKDAGLEAVTLEDSTKDALPPELADPVFSAAAGTNVGPVESAFGFHVLTVKDVKVGGTRTYDEVKEELRAELRRERALDQVFQASTKLDDALAGGASLEEAAGQVGAKVTTLERVDNQGNGPDGKPLPAAAQLGATLAPVLENGFSLKSGENSGVKEGEANSYYAVQVGMVEPAQLRPLDQVKAQVIADWKAEQRSVAAKAKADEIVAKLKEGADPAATAAGLKGALFARTQPLLRNAGRNAPVPPGVLAELFAAQPNAVASGETADGYVVAKLVQVVPVDPAANAAQVEAIRTQAAETLAGDLAGEYLAALRARYGVTVNRAAIDQMYRQPE